jgi:hypothetical protein
MPRIAKPLRLSKIIILSCWLTGAASAGVGSFDMLVVLVV